MTIDGNKPIEEIKAGDLVYSTDPETGESEYKEVVRAFRKESDVIIHIFVNGEEIETTPNHPFWVENQWVLAKDLREGDVLTLADGTTATITRTYGEQLDEPVIVYNFEVKDFHTYYVTDTGVLMHNANKYVDDGNNNNGDSEKKDPPSKKSLIKDAELPTQGSIRYVPPKDLKPAEGLPEVSVRGGKTGYRDRFGNIWVAGPSRTPGQNFEWDVQLSNKGREQIGWLTRDGSHANVSLDGRITHK